MVGTLRSLVTGAQLSRSAAQALMLDILGGNTKTEQVGALLATLYFRPPEGAALAGFAEVLRARGVRIPAALEYFPNLVDVCGTGGDGLGTFNISTAVAFVAAAAGQPIAKHGNRAVSSRCGSFDLLDSLGVPFADAPEEAIVSLRKHGLAFLYAPSFQIGRPGERSLAQIRKALGFRTVLNALGPLLNPAGVRRQLIGVYSAELVVPMAEALGELGASHALVVHGEDGIDEISLCATTQMACLQDGRVRVLSVSPEDLGLARAQPGELRGGGAAENARIIWGVLRGEQGPGSDIVALNAAASVWVGGQAESLREGLARVQPVLQRGAPYRLLSEMRTEAKAGVAS